MAQGVLCVTPVKRALRCVHISFLQVLAPPYVNHAKNAFHLTVHVPVQTVYHLNHATYVSGRRWIASVAKFQLKEEAHNRIAITSLLLFRH